MRPVRVLEAEWVHHSPCRTSGSHDLNHLQRGCLVCSVLRVDLIPMSLIRYRSAWFVASMFLMISLGAGVEARADKVDWSQYLEPSGSNKRPPPAVKPAPTAKVAKQPSKKPQASNAAKRASIKHKR